MYDLSEKTEEELWGLTTEEDADSRAEASYELAIRCARSGREEQVAGLFGAAIDIWKAADNVIGTARGNYAYGGHLNRAEKFEEALPFIADAITGYEQEAKYEWLADAINQQAIAYRGLKRSEEALADYARAIEIYADGDYFHSAACAQLEIVELLGSLDRQDEALAATSAALTFAESAEEPELSIRVHDRSAAALIDMGEYDLALERLRKALSLADYLEDGEALKYQTFRLGATLILREKFAEALSNLDRVGAAFREESRMKDVAETDLNRLECLTALGRIEEANALAIHLETYAKSIGHTRMRGLVQLWSAETRIAEGNHTRASETFSDVVAMATEADDNWLRKMAKIAWAEALLTEQKFADSFEQIKELEAKDWGQNRVTRARLLSIRAASRCFVETDSLQAQLDIAECLALGNAIGFAEAQGRCYEQLSIIRRGEGRIADAKTLMASAVGLYLRAGLTELATAKACWLLPDGYLAREPFTAPIVRPGDAKGQWSENE